MKNKKLFQSLWICSLAASTSAHAVNFNAFDPKSIAMGGAGVAIADPATAPHFNPALLSIAEKDDDFSIEFPVFGIRLSDQNEFIDKIDGTDVLVNNVDAAISNFNAQVSGGGGIPLNSTVPMVNSMNALNTKIASLSNSPIAGDGGLGLVVAIPSESFGLAFTASGKFSGAGVFNYEDSSTVTNFTSDITALDSCFSGGSITDPGVISCVESITLSSASVNIDTTSGSPTLGQVTFTTDSDINSQARFIGIGVAEVGLSISREVFFGSTNVAFGITPKSVSVSIIDYVANASSIENSIDNITDVTTDFTDFNLDVGVAKDFENGWRAGATIKNLISQEYKSKIIRPAPNDRVIIKLEPQMRAGVSHQTDWTTVAFDLDITENESLGQFNASTQYAALGVELNVWDIVQLRFGYRADLVNSNRDVLSAGFGLSPFGVHFDLGLAVGENENEAGIAFQFGFRI